MQWIDVAILIIVVGSAVIGLRRGLVVEVAGLLGFALALFVARHEYATVRNFLAMFFHRDAHLAIAAFVLVLLGVWVLVVLTARAVRTAVRLTPLGWLDRLGGAVLGLALGLVMVQALILLSSSAHDTSLHRGIHASHLAQALNHTIPGLRTLIPKRLAQIG